MTIRPTIRLALRPEQRRKLAIRKGWVTLTRLEQQRQLRRQAMHAAAKALSAVREAFELYDRAYSPGSQLTRASIVSELERMAGFQ